MKPLTSASPHAIIMVGIPGSGKSTFAEHFAETFQAPIINVGKVKNEFKLDDATAASVASYLLKELIKTHRTILIDGGADTKDQRDELKKILVKAGYKPMFVWVQTHPTEARRRATKQYPKGSSLSVEDFDEIAGIFEAPDRKEKPIVVSGKHTYVTQLKVVLKHIATPVEKPNNPPSRPTGSYAPERRTPGRGSIPIR